ncbi:MAG: DUF885 domain-containing protein [Longicatena sp.]
MKKLRRLFLCSLSLMLSISLFGCQSKDNTTQQASFNEFITSEFIDEMENDYLTTHIYLEHPENFDVNKQEIEIQIGEEINDKTIQKNINETKKAEKKFKEFDRDTLSDEQKDTYDIYNFNLTTALTSIDSKFKYYDAYFNTLTGIHTQLPVLFADLTLRNEQDVKDLILLLQSTLPYINSILTYTKQQSKEGLLSIDMERVLSDVKKTLETQENSSTLTSMYKNIDKLTLSAELKTSYKEKVKEAFMNSFIPAYQNMYDTLTSLKLSKNNTEGICNFEYGKEYYEMLFSNAISSSLSIKKTKKLLENTADKYLTIAQSVILKDEKVYENLQNDKYVTNYTNFESMLKDINKGIEKDFPSIGKLSYEIAPLDKDLQNQGVAAYFNLPAIDGTTPKQIRVNTNGTQINSIETFTTLAHEGIPGHMYQVSYAYENLRVPYRKVFSNATGYTEGYATYVEYYATKYLTDIDENAIKLQNALAIYQQCLLALSDIGIHYEGWNVNDLKDFYTKKGLELDKDSFTDLYQQIQANPTAFLSYYVGFAQFDKLQEKAKDKLGKNYRDKDFHEAILKSGAAPFEVVEKNVDAYISSKK